VIPGAPALLLADGRFPAGGHAHSGGLEAAVAAGSVQDLGTLALFLRGRLRTAGVLSAALTAIACRYACDSRGAADREAGWAVLDAETDARTPSPAQRTVSRQQGRALLRAARAAWPGAPELDGLGAPDRPGGAAPHQCLVLGAAAAAAGCGPGEAALIAAYQSVSGPASAAVRLLALDPLQVSGLLARLTAEINAAAVLGDAGRSLEDLPYTSAPALDLLAEAHARNEMTLFAS
jgi:urease accessory protein